MESIAELDTRVRAEFEARRREVMYIAGVCDRLGIRGEKDGIYRYYEGSDYIGLETYNLDVFLETISLSKDTMGPGSINTVLEIDGRINAFYRFDAYPIFSLRRAMNPEDFPIEDIQPGYEIVFSPSQRWDVVRKP